MKRRLLILGLILMLAVLSACAGEQTAGPEQQGQPAPVQPETVPEPKPEPPSAAEPVPEASGGKTLVVLFSATGNTRPIAQSAAQLLEADFYEIIPQQPYTEADLAYYTDCRADQEQQDDAARPAISGSVEHMEDYDTILIGYPIWHGQPPKIIYTFLESYDFSGKTILPFCTSGSSPYSDSGIRSLVGDNTTWLQGRRFAAGADRQQVEEWLTEAGLLTE